MMISNWKNLFRLHGLYKNISALKGLKWVAITDIRNLNKNICQSSNVIADFCFELSSFNSYSAGIDFSRQNLTSADVRFWRLKLIPAL